MEKKPRRKRTPKKQDKDAKSSGLMDWSPVIIQVIVLGGFMFLVQQIYTSIGTHEAIKYNFEVVEESPEEQLVKLTVYKIGPNEKNKVKFLFTLLDTADHQILGSEIRKCEEGCVSGLFTSHRTCVDITPNTYVRPSDPTAETSEREFLLQTFPGNSLYEVDIRIRSIAGKSTSGVRVFRIIDGSTILGNVIAEYPEKLKFEDRLAMCRNQFFFIALLVVLGAVLGIHKLRKLYGRRIT